MGAFAVQLILSSYNLTSLTDSRKMTNFVHNPDSPPPCWQLPASYVEAGVVWVPGLTPRHLPAVTHQEHGMNLFSKCLEVSQLYLKAETVNHLLVFLFGNLVTKIINEHHS